MAKKRKLARTVKPQQSWWAQKLAWLAAFFGVSLFLLTAVTYMGLNGKNTQVLETTTGTVIKEWNFANPEDIGQNAWKSYMILTDNIKSSPAPVPVTAPALSTVTAAPTTYNHKFPLTMKLTGTGWVNIFSDSEVPDKTTMLYNTFPQINLTSIKTDIVVEMVMKADFRRLIDGQLIGGVTTNRGRMTMYFGEREYLVRDSKGVSLDSNGQATYKFVFERAQIRPRLTKVLALTIQPTLVDNTYLLGLNVDRITVSAK